MKNIYTLLFLGLFCSAGFAQRYQCLPSEVKADSVVGTAPVTSATGQALTDKITVKQTLKKLGARCSHGKLVDGKGKSIAFYHLQGCWGNPPADYLEIMNRQREELSRLKSKNTVIEMSCNAARIPTP